MSNKGGLHQVHDTYFSLWSRLHTKQTVPDKTDLTVDKSNLSRLGTFKSTSSRLPKSTPRSAYRIVLRLLFGADGLDVTGDEVVFDNRGAAVQQYVNMYRPQVEDYILDRTIPRLLTNCQTLWRPLCIAGIWSSSRLWRHNRHLAP